jgi:hypothetical protein
MFLHTQWFHCVCDEPFTATFNYCIFMPLLNLFNSLPVIAAALDYKQLLSGVISDSLSQFAIAVLVKKTIELDAVPIGQDQPNEAAFAQENNDN